MPKQSAGLLVYRVRDSEREVFLVHPGGPFWAKKDAGAWTIPKGEIEAGEDPLVTAQREFTEETSMTIAGPFTPIGSVRQAGGKTIQAFAVEADFEAEKIVSSTFRLEWPPRSGKHADFPEVDRAAWFTLPAAEARINPAQIEFLRRLKEQEAKKPGN